MSMPCTVRVLVVDNDLDARSLAVRILVSSGYEVRAAEGQGVELRESAKQLARKFKPHVVIMDLRLSDEHADDRSGLELWRDESFSSARCILYSAHLVQNYKITREAFQQNGVEDVIGKEDSPQDLVDAVERAARKGCGCTKALSLVWPHAWNEETIIQGLYKEEENVPRDLVVDLLGRMFPDVKRLVLRPLDGTVKSPVPASLGRSVLFQIWPDDKEPQVLKFAQRKRIQREVNAYNDYIKDRLAGRFYAELQRCAFFWDLGGICYSFIGSPQHSIESFASFYRHTGSSDEIIKPLGHFFEEVWHRRYTDAIPLTTTLFDSYDPKRKLYQRLGNLSVRGETLALPGLPGTFPNPASWLNTYAEDSYYPHAHQAIVHGDLHGDNLFVDKDHAWVIDFERSGISHVLRDFVELEQNIITRLMRLPDIDTHLLYSLAVCITKTVSAGELVAIPPDLENNVEIKKAVQVINGLRSIAYKVTRYRDMREYYWGLLMETAFSLTLADAYSSRWWRSLLLSSVLCSRLNNWGSEWPSAELPSLDQLHTFPISPERSFQPEELGGNVDRGNIATHKTMPIFQTPSSEPRTMSDPEIFVSYAWNGESEALVDQLCQTFAMKGYSIIRDKASMTYKNSIKDFMDSIGRGKFIVVVVSDKYMKSEYCMYEAYRMFQSASFRARVFPIVLPDADIFSVHGQLAYLRHWQTEYEALEKEYKSVANSSPTMAAPFAERLRDIEVTTRFINDFMAAVSDMNVLTSQIHTESSFSQLIQTIEARISQAEK